MVQDITNISLAMLQQCEQTPYPRGGGRQRNQWQSVATCFNYYERGHIAPNCLHLKRRGGEMYPILHLRKLDHEAEGRVVEVRREVKSVRHELNKQPTEPSSITLIRVSTFENDTHILANKRMQKRSIKHNPKERSKFDFLPNLCRVNHKRRMNQVCSERG